MEGEVTTLLADLLNVSRADSSADLASTCRCLSATALHLLPTIDAAAVVVSDTVGSALICVSSRDSAGGITTAADRAEMGIPDLLTKERLLDAVAAKFPLAVPSASDRGDQQVVYAEFPEIPAAVVLFGATAGGRRRAKAGAVDSDQDLLLATIRQQTSRCCGRVLVFPDALHLEALAEFCAGAGHEINNPLGSIVGQVQRLSRIVDSPDAENALASIGAQAWRVRDMIGDAMTFARPPAPEFGLCDPAQILDQIEDSLADACRQANARMTALWHSSDSEMRVRADETQIRNLISLLVRNSLEAIAGSEQSGTVDVECRDAESPEFWQISVRDTGPGIADEQTRRHLFDPFYSGRQAGRGLGFGLPLCWRIAMAHGGCIQFSEQRASGCEFLVTLPTDPRRRVS